MARGPNFLPTVSLAVAGVSRIKKKIAAVSGMVTGAVVLRIESLLLKRVKERFITKTDHRGRTWAPLKQSTLERRARFMRSSKFQPTAFGIAHRGILVLTGGLAASVSVNRPGSALRFSTSTGVGFRIGTNHPAAALHQFGNSAKNTPARPFLSMGLRDSFSVERLLLRTARRLGLR